MAQLKIICTVAALMTTASLAQAEQLYVGRLAGTGTILRVNDDGTGEEILVDWDDVQAVILAEAGSGCDHTGPDPDFFIDSAAGKIYLKTYVQGQFCFGGGMGWYIMRCNLDGTGLEFLFTEGGGGSEVGSVQTLQATAVPAVGSLGLGVMVLLLLGAGGVVMRRRVPA